MPVGPDNKVEPAPVDQGQPTVFFPGRQYGVFTMARPKGQPNAEMVWSLTVAGRTVAIPANVANQEFFIDPYQEMGGSFPGNKPPELKLESAAPALKGPMGGTVTRTAAVGTPLQGRRAGIAVLVAEHLGLRINPFPFQSIERASVFGLGPGLVPTRDDFDKVIQLPAVGHNRLADMHQFRCAFADHMDAEKLPILTVKQEL